ncbi:hypothetical protein OAT84_02915 [Gammaproteobacteria bacterium]|nr:hypothetical protein [Gammaproteobacteria bacterium]
MSHVKLTLAASKFFQTLKSRASSQSLLQKQVFSLLSPCLQKDVIAVYERYNICYVEINSSYAIMAIKHALKNLGVPVRILIKQRD